jgi:hypothetical protein
VDRCSRPGADVDISTAAGPAIVGAAAGFHRGVTVDVVAQEHCRGVWSGEMHPSAGPGALSAPGIASFRGMLAAGAAGQGLVKQIAGGQVQVDAPMSEELATPTSTRRKQALGVGASGLAQTHSQAREAVATVQTPRYSATDTVADASRTTWVPSAYPIATGSANVSFFAPQTVQPPRYCAGPLTPLSSAGGVVGISQALMLLLVPLFAVLALL